MKIQGNLSFNIFKIILNLFSDYCPLLLCHLAKNGCLPFWDGMFLDNLHSCMTWNISPTHPYMSWHGMGIQIVIPG